MISLVAATLVLLGGVDTLGSVSLGKLSLKAPTQWERTAPDENSLTWDEPQSGASFALSVYVVDPQRTAKLCLTQLTEALGKEGYAPLPIGGQPAAKKVTTDVMGDKKEKVTTTTVTGCNGKTKWVLTWTAKTEEGPRFGPILKRVLDSISYGK